jgi:LacI family transcriptional regulator
VVGVDNDPIVAELGVVSLTSVDLARQRVGYEAAALLDRLMSGEKPPKKPIYVPPSGVVVRQSTQTLAVSDADVAKAIRFVHDNFRKPISVADVAANTFLSRRQLQTRFLKAVGHGMNEEISRQRIEFCKYLLTQTAHKVSAIATMSGFSDLNRMGKTFKRKVGITPQEYRRTYHPVLAQIQGSDLSTP